VLRALVEAFFAERALWSLQLYAYSTLVVASTSLVILLAREYYIIIHNTV